MNWARSGDTAHGSAMGRPSQATPARQRAVEPAKRDQGVSEREGAGDVATTSRRRRRLTGATPASNRETNEHQTDTSLLW